MMLGVKLSGVRLATTSASSDIACSWLMFFFMPMTFIAGWGYSEIAVSAVFAPMAIFIALLITLPFMGTAMATYMDTIFQRISGG